MDVATLIAALGTERKAFDFEVKDIDDAGVFTGYAGVYGNVDLGGDLIERGAFTKTVQERPQVPILWHHNRDEPIGVGRLAEDDKGLAVEGKLTLGVQRAREAHALMKDGAVSGLSIGYRAVKKAMSGRVRYLKEVAVKEFSPVTFPMNELALVGDVKSAELIPPIADLLRRLRDEDPEAVKSLLEQLEPGGSPLGDEGADTKDAEPDWESTRAWLVNATKELS